VSRLVWPSSQMSLRKPLHKSEPFEAPSASELKARAVRLLSMREHTRAELARKLGAISEDADLINSVIEDLARGGWQSDERFAKTFGQHKSNRQGSMLIAQAMRQKGLPAHLIEDTVAELAATELSRARVVWEKKFGAQGRPTTREQYAKQGRFLAGRGFGSDIIRRVLGHGQDSDEGEQG
jgi:regulatory protein